MEFYVYEHWRTDKNECFYVGKGQIYKGKPWRARDMSYRNNIHKSITAQLRALHIQPEVRIIFSSSSEREAYDKEISTIKMWRESGNPLLANLTNGGSGYSGWKHTDESRRKISDAQRGKKRPDLGGPNHPCYGKGKKFGFHLTHNLAEENRKRIWTMEARLQSSISRKGQSPTVLGKHWILGDKARRTMGLGQTMRRIREAVKRSSIINYASCRV